MPEFGWFSNSPGDGSEVEGDDPGTLILIGDQPPFDPIPVIPLNRDDGIVAGKRFGVVQCQMIDIDGETQQAYPLSGWFFSP